MKFTAGRPIPMRMGTRHHGRRTPAAVIACLLLLATSSLHGAGTLYFVDLFKPQFTCGSIKCIRSDGSGLETIQNTGWGLRALAVNPAAGTIYWSDVNERTLSCLDLSNGTARILLKISDSEEAYPLKMTLHPPSGKMFWGDASSEQVRSMDVDGETATAISDAHYRNSLAVDHQNRLYWIAATTTGYLNARQPGTSHFSIRRANIDGSGMETIAENRGWLADLALDPLRNRLYFISQDADTIYVSTLDGQNIRPFLCHRPEEDVREVAVDPVTGDLYWTEKIILNRERIKTQCAATGAISAVGPREGFGNISSLIFIPDKTETPVSRLNKTAPQSRRIPKPTAGTSLPRDQKSGLSIQLRLNPAKAFSLDFDSTPGRRYQVQYSNDLKEWHDAGPPITAQTRRSAWHDHGPPMTPTLPQHAPRRFYRIMTLEQ